MNKNKILEYINNTPHNTNPAILLQLIRDIDDEELVDLRGTKVNESLISEEKE